MSIKQMNDSLLKKCEYPCRTRRIEELKEVAMRITTGLALLWFSVVAGGLMSIFSGDIFADESSDVNVASTVTLVRDSLPAVVTIQSDAENVKRSGTGFIVDSTGIVVTNLHLVRGAQRVAIKLHEGEVYDQVRVAGYDDKRDLVLLKFAGFNLPTLEMGDSDTITTGERVIVIGHPVGLQETVTEGIVSSVRVLDSGVKVIQTDAAASPGSSGGPMLNDSGEVIGVVTFKNVGGESLNFAMPINYARGLLSLETQLSLNELEEKLSGHRDLFAEDENEGLAGRWKSLTSGRIVVLREKGEYIYGDLLNADGSATALSLELRKQSEDAYAGRLRGVWPCWYMGGFVPRRIDKTCNTDYEVNLTVVDSSRMEGKALYPDAPPRNTQTFVRYCKSCGESVTATWHELTFVRED